MDFVQRIMRDKFVRVDRGVFEWRADDGTVCTVTRVNGGWVASVNDLASMPKFSENFVWAKWANAVNSLIDVARAVMAIPRVGRGATLCYPSDAYPYVITDISKSGKVITLAELSSDSRKLDIKTSSDWISRHYYTAAEIADPSLLTGKVIKAYKTKRGFRAYRCIPVGIGYATYQRDWSD